MRKDSMALEIAASQSKLERKGAWFLGLAIIAVVVGGGLALVTADDRETLVTVPSEP
jgi:hypothetical protein